MGALFKGVCYPDPAVAKAEVCNAQWVTWGSGDNVMTAECTSSNFDLPSMSVCRRTNGGICTTSSTPYPAFSPCDYAGSQNLAYEWFLMALGLLVVVWGGKQLMKLFDSHQDRD